MTALSSPVLHFDNLEMDTHIRVVMQNGQPMFVAKDVCTALGISNSRDALATLDDDEKITVANPDGNPRAGIPHELAFVTESGLYALVFKSRKEAARRFRKWVTSDVLPSLRERRISMSRPAWLEAMQFHIDNGSPPDVAKVAALIGLGVDPTTAAKLSMPRPFRISKDSPLIESPDIVDAEEESRLLSLLTHGRKYPFADIVAIAVEQGLFRGILLGKNGQETSLTDGANSAFGLRLGRIAQRVPAFRILGKGRSRRYVLMPPQG